MAAVNAHQFGSAADVSLGFQQFSLNEFPMVSVRGFLERRKSKGRSRRLLAPNWREISDADLYLRCHNHHPLDRIPQLTHVARPGIVLQSLHRFRFETLGLLSVSRREFMIEVFDEGGHVL